MWGVKVILMREGMVCVLCGWKVVGGVVGVSGEVSIGVSTVEGCVWFVVVCKGGGVGTGGFQVGSGVWTKLSSRTCVLSLDFFLVFFVHGEKLFSGAFRRLSISCFKMAKSALSLSSCAWKSILAWRSIRMGSPYSIQDCYIYHHNY